MATRKLPKGATTRRPSSRGYASNAAKIESLVPPERVPSNNPSTMSSRRDIQSQAFREAKTGVSETYKFDAKGNKIPVSEEEFKKAAQKFVNAERKIPKGTSLSQVKAAKFAGKEKLAELQNAVTKAMNKKLDTLSAAERKMAREGIAPPRAPATPPTAASAPAKPAVKKAAKKVAPAPKAAAPAKMTRAERSAANKAKHAVDRAAEMKKWAEQKAAKKGAVAKPAAAKPAAAKPAKPAASKPVVAKPAAVKPAAKPVVNKPAATAKPAPKPAAAKPAPTPAASDKPKINQERAARMGVKPVPREGMAKPATPLPMAEKPAPKSWIARTFPNVSTVVKEGLLSPAGRAAGLQAGKNLAAGLLSRGNVAFTTLTYSKGLNEGEDAVLRARNLARLNELRKTTGSVGPTNPRGGAKGVSRTAASASARPAAPASARPAATAKQGVSGFGAAFKQARQARLAGTAGDTFQYGGKTYTSYQRGEQPRAAVPKAPIPVTTSYGDDSYRMHEAFRKEMESNMAKTQPSMSAAQLEEQFKKKKGPR